MAFSSRKKPSPSLIDLHSWKKLSLKMGKQMGIQPFLFLILSMTDFKRDWFAVYEGTNNYTVLDASTIT